MIVGCEVRIFSSSDGATFDGQDRNRLFAIGYGGHLSLEKIHLANGRATSKVAGFEQGASQGGCVLIIDRDLGQGGAYASASFRMSDAKMSGCHVSYALGDDGKGGALCAYFRGADHAQVVLTNVAIDSTSSLLEGGALYFYGQVIATLVYVRITSTRAGGNGGAIGSQQNSLSMNNCAIENTDSDQNGGAIWLNAAVVDLVWVNVSHTRAAFAGGTIYAAGASRVQMEDVNIGDSFALTDGGVLYLSASSDVTLTGVTVSSYSARRNGGLVYSSNALVKLRNVTSYAGQAGGSGGLLYGTGTSQFDVLKLSGHATSASGAGGLAYFEAATSARLDFCDLSTLSASAGPLAYLRGEDVVVQWTSISITGLQCSDGPVMTLIEREHPLLDPGASRDSIRGLTVTMKNSSCEHSQLIRAEGSSTRACTGVDGSHSSIYNVFTGRSEPM